MTTIQLPTTLDQPEQHLFRAPHPETGEFVYSLITKKPINVGELTAEAYIKVIQEAAEGHVMTRTSWEADQYSLGFFLLCGDPIEPTVEQIALFTESE